jgi:hypothetical protein
MNGVQVFQMVLAVIAVNASVLGVVLFALYQLNKAVSPSGR